MAAPMAAGGQRGGKLGSFQGSPRFCRCGGQGGAAGSIALHHQPPGFGRGPQTQKRDRGEEPGREAGRAPRKAGGAVRRTWKGGAGGPRGAQNLMAFR